MSPKLRLVKPSPAPVLGCGVCKFARPLKENDNAIACQRFPPLVTSVVNGQVSSNWPLLAKENWCGEFRR